MVLDPSIAERVAKHRELRADLDAAFGGVLDEPIPARLLETANSSPTEFRTGTVSDLRAIREAKARVANPKRWSWPEWTSIAASLLIGVLAGRAALQPSQSNMFATTDSGIVASGELSAALNNQASGTANGAAVHIGLSFRSKGGDYCRAFSTNSAAGFACHEAAEWKVRALSESGTNATGGEYRMAGSELPPSILTAIESAMEGEALDEEQEQTARARGWKK
jgi:hypothetical protein